MRSDENYPGVIRPSNSQGGLRPVGGKLTAGVGNNRRALSKINTNIIGAPPYPCAVHKRGVLTEKNASIYKNPAIPAHRPVTRAPGTWRWMLGVAGIPALVQFVLMLYLPESPRWLYRKDKVKEARAILEKIYPADEVEDELKALKSSIEAEKADQDSLGDGLFSKLKNIWGNNVRELEISFH
ncbi:hypothetical protein CASFOL_037909 [Castilleja foliolosa]|uniref:Major facilitator superfamily (MFS) profile domain-containing protein n=1 Tax=Castilleja foliolosa TaxID=1961234 RepID=A0ABD3BJG4_9LAMI